MSLLLSILGKRQCELRRTWRRTDGLGSKFPKFLRTCLSPLFHQKDKNKTENGFQTWDRVVSENPMTFALGPCQKPERLCIWPKKRIAWCYWSIDFWYGEEIWWQLSYILWSQLACGSFRCCCPSRFSDAAVAIAWWLWLLITDPSYRTKQQWYQHRFSTSLIVDEEHPQKKSIIYGLSEHPDQHKQTSFRRIKESFFAFVTIVVIWQ